MSSLNIVAKGENLIYVCGIIAAAALAMQVAISQVRHKIRYFRQMHRFFAVVLLLVAAAHWWPFTFFLIPATGVHATSVAIKQFVAQQELPHPATGHTGKALSCAKTQADPAAGPTDSETATEGDAEGALGDAEVAPPLHAPGIPMCRAWDDGSAAAVLSVDP